jgi:hypothetical protein
MDVTWGRNWADRETYFAGITADHIVVTQGRNLEPLEGGHFYLWYYWWDNMQPDLTDDELWYVTKVDN